MDFTFDFTEEKLEICIPKNPDPDVWFVALSEHLPKFAIVTPPRVAGFLSQCGHESLDFTALSENLNYSATALNSVFPKYFKRAGRDAQEYHRQPEKIANVVYANRMDNGDEASGDGWRFRGRGIVQLTGRANYTQCSMDLFGNTTLVDNPDLVSEPKYAVLAACWFWHKNRLNDLCDHSDVVKLSKRVNGGTHGLADRVHRWNRCLEVFEGSYQEPLEEINQTLRKGSRGPLVAQIQRELRISPQDGIFGEATERAVKQWQSNNGLTSDGVAGPKTLKKLLG